EVIEDLIDGILVLTEQREIIYANESARRILRQLNQGKTRNNLVPKEIWHICQSLIQSRSLFPNQRWLIESRIFADNSTAFNIRVRWINLENVENSCILITVEDRYQAIKNIAVEEAQGYGLTRREKEVWLLHRGQYTYKEIASELCITPNTVKKHMKSIHAKQRENGGSDTEN
ncbi:MAG TPA: LuxR C-terminal-related transcriptional regulator, partial [Coleofasciculaceae cyanobacterium]